MKDENHVNLPPCSNALTLYVSSNNIIQYTLNTHFIAQLYLSITYSLLHN